MWELIAQKGEVIRVYRDKKYDSLVGGQFSIEEGQARFLDPHSVEVGGKRLTGARFLVATGSRPVVPEIPGLDGRRPTSLVAMSTSLSSSAGI